MTTSAASVNEPPEIRTASSN